MSVFFDWYEESSQKSLLQNRLFNNFRSLSRVDMETYVTLALSSLFVNNDVRNRGFNTQTKTKIGNSPIAKDLAPQGKFQMYPRNPKFKLMPL